MRTCPNCQNTVSDEAARFCDNCGGPLPAPAENPVQSPAGQFKPPIGGEAASACPDCGFTNQVGSKFCDNCGLQLLTVAAPLSPIDPPLSGDAAGGCPNCGFLNQPGSLFCDNCGVQLPPVIRTAPPPSAHLPSAASSPFTMATQPIGGQLRRAEIEIPPITIITGRFETQDSGAIIHFPPGKAQIMIGREDPVDGAFPEIDLNPYRGEELGVSRRHALISIENGRLFIEDLGSTNYTHLNQNRLESNQRYPLNDGAEIRFGRLGVVYRHG